MQLLRYCNVLIVSLATKQLSFYRPTSIHNKSYRHIKLYLYSETVCRIPCSRPTQRVLETNGSVWRLLQKRLQNARLSLAKCIQTLMQMLFLRNAAGLLRITELLFTWLLYTWLLYTWLLYTWLLYTWIKRSDRQDAVHYNNKDRIGHSRSTEIAIFSIDCFRINHAQPKYVKLRIQHFHILTENQARPSTTRNVDYMWTNQQAWFPKSEFF